jgi:hypothetical protein
MVNAMNGNYDGKQQYSEGREAMRITFVLPPKREQQDLSPPIDVAAHAPADPSRPGLPKPATERVGTPFGPWRVESDRNGWMK